MVNIIIQTKGGRLELRPEESIHVRRGKHQQELAARDVRMEDEIWEDSQWRQVKNVPMATITIQTSYRKEELPFQASFFVMRNGQRLHLTSGQIKSGDHIFVDGQFRPVITTVENVVIETIGRKFLWPSEASVSVIRNGRQVDLTPRAIENGDQIWADNQWFSVESAYPNYGDFNKGTRERFCFPASATVTLEDGRRVPIGDVGSGFRVKVMDSFGKRTISIIYFQAHANRETRLDCVSISAGGKTLELSPGHYLFVVSEHGQRRQVTAREVKVGDVILVDDKTADFRQASVTSVELVERQGMYAPLTLEGSIVVNDVVCSCYTDAWGIDPATSHALLWPLRRLWQLSPAGVAVACKPCDLEGRPALAGWFLDNVLSLLPSSSPL